MPVQNVINHSRESLHAFLPSRLFGGELNRLISVAATKKIQERSSTMGTREELLLGAIGANRVRIVVRPFAGPIQAVCAEDVEQHGRCVM